MPRKNEEEINKELLESSVERERLENSKLIQNVVSLGDSATCLKEYMELMQSFFMRFVRFSFSLKRVEK